MWGLMTYTDVHGEILWLQGPSRAIFTVSAVKICEKSDIEILLDMGPRTFFGKHF